MKATRNKTIDLSVEEGQKYLNRCITLEQSAPLSSVLDKTILGDTFNTIPYLPKNFVDLLIVDPPYNLDKNFNGKQFKQLNDTDYEEYTKQWIQKVIPLLKDTASVYVCCDWKSSLIIGNILKQYFFLQNRITWQREKGRGAMSNWKNGMEDIWFATKSKNFTLSSASKIPSLSI